MAPEEIEIFLQELSVRRLEQFAIICGQKIKRKTKKALVNALVKQDCLNEIFSGKLTNKQRKNLKHRSIV